MTLPNTYSWSPVGKRLYVPYEAPQGRRVNAAGALFHSSDRFEFLTRARAPKTKRKAISSLADGLEASELGVLNAEVLIAFIWHIAGRPENAPEDWRRDKPLVIVLDNYSVHVGKRFQQERERWRAADIDLFFLPSYSPDLSSIEPLWRDVKQHRMRRLSRDKLLDLKRDVEAALAEKASSLISANSSTGTA
jgi:transposase